MGNRFHRARVGMTSYDPAPVVVPGDAIAPPQVNSDAKAQAIEAARITANVGELAREGRSFTETVILTSNVDNVWRLFALPSAVLITFLVPNGRSLWVERLGWRFTDPYMHSCLMNDLEIHVNLQRVPWYRNGAIDADPVAASAAEDVGFRMPMGSITDPMEIEPIYVPEGSLFEVLLVSQTGAAEYVGLSVRLIGRLRKVAGGAS